MFRVFLGFNRTAAIVSSFTETECTSITYYPISILSLEPGPRDGAFGFTVLSQHLAWRQSYPLGLVHPWEIQFSQDTPRRQGLRFIFLENGFGT